MDLSNVYLKLIDSISVEQFYCLITNNADFLKKDFPTTWKASLSVNQANQVLKKRRTACREGHLISNFIYYNNGIDPIGEIIVKNIDVIQKRAELAYYLDSRSLISLQ